MLRVAQGLIMSDTPIQRDPHAEAKEREDQQLFTDMAKAWTNVAWVDGDVSKLAAEELSKEKRAEGADAVCENGQALGVA